MYYRHVFRNWSIFIETFFWGGEGIKKELKKESSLLILLKISGWMDTMKRLEDTRLKFWRGLYQ